MMDWRVHDEGEGWVWEESLSESARRAAVIERGEGGDRGWMRWMEVFTMGDARARMGED